MKKVCMFLLAFVFVSLQSFSQGVNFENLTFQQALDKAAVENKLVFFDGYTTWCGPCKNMTENVFPQKECGDFFNPRFVNVKFDMEKGEGVELRKKYEVKAYPTFLILNPQGEVVYRIVGGGSVESFIARVERGLDPKYSLATLEKEYASGKMKPARILDYMKTLDDAYDKEKKKEVTEAFEKNAGKKDKLSESYWTIFSNPYENPPTLERVNFVLENEKKLRKNVGDEKIDKYIEDTYTTILSRHITGKVKNENGKEEVAQVRELVQNSTMAEKENLLFLAEVADAVLEKDGNKIFTLYEENLSLLTEKGFYPYLSAFNILDRKNKTEMARIVALGDRALEGMEEGEAKTRMDRMFSGYRKAAAVGVYWENATLEEAIQVAKYLRRPVFVDCYTTWCGPCKYMADQIFTQEQVGDYFNNKFTNLKIDMEKGDGPEIAKKYGIRAYPTFLIINGEGEVMHKIIGGGDADGFIKKVEEAFDPEKATGVWDKKYAEGNRDKEFLKGYVQKLKSMYEANKGKEVAAELMAGMTDEEKLDPSMWFIYEDISFSPRGSENFEFLVKNKAKFIAAQGEEKVSDVFMKACFTPISMVLSGRDEKATVADMDQLKKEVATYKLKNQAEINGNIELAKAYLGGDLNRLIAVSKQQFKNMSESSIGSVGISVVTNIMQKGNEKQKEQAKELVKVLQAKATDNRLKAYLESMIK